MTEPDRYASWPTLLAELAQLIGEEATLRLAHEYGGQEREPIPKRVDTDHRWRAVVGDEKWFKIVGRYGGQYLNLPRGVFLTIRKWQILDLAKAGVAHRQIALRTKSTERYVREVLQDIPEPADPRQLSLLDRLRKTAG